MAARPAPRASGSATKHPRADAARATTELSTAEEAAGHAPDQPVGDLSGEVAAEACSTPPHDEARGDQVDADEPYYKL